MSFIRNIFDAINNNLISGGAYYLIAKSVIVTIILVVIAWVVTVVIGSVLSYFMSYHKRGISGLAHAISFIFRSTPVVLLLLLFYYVVFKRLHLSITLISGIAIGLYGAGHFAQIIARQVREAKKHQDAVVIRRLKQVYFTVTLPQTVEDTLFMVKRLAILLLQWTTIVSYISVNDLTEVMTRIGQRTMYPFFSIFVCIIFYLVMTIMIEGIFYAIKKKITGEEDSYEDEEMEGPKRIRSSKKEQDDFLGISDEIPDVEEEDENEYEYDSLLPEEEESSFQKEDTSEELENEDYLVFTKDLAKQVEEEFEDELIHKENLPNLEDELEEFNKEE
ncbi:ABC transporter permease subunit [Lachnoclostridium phytofermentans]|uniref:ABC transporter permease subunit n=1 Tax=Lachnoclostridium phytofermentans TaxID=66219 RepID=UPI0004972B30|nr:ABC transporter permease subunit [Lachnoclostridium phytofermentans]